MYFHIITAYVTKGPPGPVDSDVDGINPETIPIIIGSCVGAFILIVTAAWFTATCIKKDGYRRSDSDVKDYEAGEKIDGQASMYVNESFDPDQDINPAVAAAVISKAKSAKDYAEKGTENIAHENMKYEAAEKGTENIADAIKKKAVIEKLSENAEKEEFGGAHDNPTYEIDVESALEARSSDNGSKNASEDGKGDDYEIVKVKKEGSEAGEGANESEEPAVPSTNL